MTDQGAGSRHIEGSGEGLLSFLSAKQVEMIDEALRSLGDFGEVRLLVQKGRLRFVVTQRSYDALSWESGNLDEELSAVEVPILSEDQSEPN